MHRDHSKIWLYMDPVARVDGALSAALEATRRSGAELEIVTAIGRSEDRIFQTSFGLEILRIVRDDRTARLEELESVAAAALGAERVRTTFLEGEVPWHSLVLHAVAHAPDLVVVPSDGAAAQRSTSTVQHLFRKCPAPVWAVRGDDPPFPRRVIAAVDPGLPGSAERHLAHRVLAFAQRLVGGGALQLHVAHAWGVPGESLLRARLGARAAERHLELGRQASQEQLEQLLAQAEVRPSGVTVHLARGEPDRVVRDLAERLEADVVVLGSTGRSGLAGFLIGSTAEAIIAATTRSIAVVKPEGFVSPARAAS